MSLVAFFRDRIEAAMQSPEQRDAAWEAHIRGVQKAAASAKANMQHPTKVWGFWRNEKHNAKFEMNADPATSKLPGRRDLGKALSQ